MTSEQEKLIIEFAAFLDAVPTDEMNLHRLLGISVQDAIEYQIFMRHYAKNRNKGDGSQLIIEQDESNLLLLFGAWFALYKRKKR
jgi:hypothetical protein